MYTAEGKTPAESLKKEEATQVVKDKEFLLGAKGIKLPKLEAKEAGEVEADEVTEDDLDF